MKKILNCKDYYEGYVAGVFGRSWYDISNEPVDRVYPKGWIVGPPKVGWKDIKNIAAHVAYCGTDIIRTKDMKTHTLTSVRRFYVVDYLDLQMEQSDYFKNQLVMENDHMHVFDIDSNDNRHMKINRPVVDHTLTLEEVFKNPDLESGQEVYNTSDDVINYAKSFNPMNEWPCINKDHFN